MTTPSIDSYDHCEQLSQYLHLGYLHLAAAALDDPLLPEDLKAWLGSRLTSGAGSSPRAPFSSKAVPLAPAVQHNWQGWHAFLTGRYAQANEAFTHAWQLDAPVATRLDISLGLARVYTRTGHWHSARQWALGSLKLARSAHRLYDTVRGYGVLGDLLLRAGYSRESFFCLSSAWHLMPPGAGQRSRQMNYLASALMRMPTNNRDIHDAESLLMTSIQMATETGDGFDQTSVRHALARLQFLWLKQDRHDDVLVQLNDVSEQLTSDHADPAASGFLDVSRAFAACRRGNQNEALSYASTAARIFGNHLPGERLWAAGLCRALGAPESALPLPVLQPMPCPMSSGVIDQAWQRLEMTEQGMRELDDMPGSVSSLEKLRRIFFL